MKPFKRLRTEKFSQEVANQIKESIFDGTYVLGDRLPSESEMAGMFGASNVTVRQAVRVLENSGILFTKQGVDGGIFVADADIGSCPKGSLKRTQIESISPKTVRRRQGFNTMFCSKAEIFIESSVPIR